MDLIKSPDGIIAELVSIRESAAKGVEMQYEVEVELVGLQLAAERAEMLALLEAGGTVVDRQATAKLASAELREKADLCRARLSRIKLKMKQLSEAQMSVQTQARMVELTYKTAGVGER